MDQAQKVSAAEIQRYLKGVSYPCSKEDLVSKAREQSAPPDVISMIERLPMEEFSGSQEVMKALGEEKR